VQLKVPPHGRQHDLPPARADDERVAVLKGAVPEEVVGEGGEVRRGSAAVPSFRVAIVGRSGLAYDLNGEARIPVQLREDSLVDARPATWGDY